MSKLASFKHKCFFSGGGALKTEDHCESDVTGNGIEIEQK